MITGLSDDEIKSVRKPPDILSRNGHSNPLSILLVDDNPAVARAMEIALRLAGHRLTTAMSPEEAYSRLASERFDVILLDMNFTTGESSGMEGLACLTRLKGDDPAARVVVLTAHSGIRIAVAAMQAGARDFVMKPWRNAELVGKIEAAAACSGPDVRSIPATVHADGEPVRLLGESAAMHRLRDLVHRLGPTSAGVTVTGRPGSGRTLTARALHAASADACNAPLRVDLRDTAAWFDIGTGSGTIILRFVDQLDSIAQTRLLDLLPTTVRCIAIAESIAPLDPSLRRRVATVELEVPPLSAREDDVCVLARHFAQAAAARYGRPETRLSKAAETLIAASEWPDEVRGLAVAIERAVLLADNGVIDAAALALPASAAPGQLPERSFDLLDSEKAVIETALREHRHNVSRAAAALGLSRGALYRRMLRHGL